MIYPIAYQRTDRILLAKFRRICLEGEALEAIGVEAEAVCKYTASHSCLTYFRHHYKPN